MNNPNLLFYAIALTLAACGAGQPTTGPGPTAAPTVATVPSAATALPTELTKAATVGATGAAAPTAAVTGILSTLLAGSPLENILAAVTKAESGNPVRIKGTTSWTSADGRTISGTTIIERIPKDRLHLINTSAAGSKSEIIRIADTTYTRVNEGAWRKTTVTLPTPSPNAPESSDDSAVLGQLRTLKEIPEIKPAGLDVVDGVPVTGVSIALKPAADGGPQRGAGTMTIWVSADGLIRKSEMQLTMTPTGRPAIVLPTPRAGATVDPLGAGRQTALEITSSAVSIKNLRTYQYDPSIKIEAPIP